MRSGLYEGTVRHRRLAGPVRDEFRQRLFMAYLDLDELPAALEAGPLSSGRHPALAWFRRADHLGEPCQNLAESVRELVAERTGCRPNGPVALLTNLRCFGHNFNPVSFYWCFGSRSGHVEAVVAHVTNTPWGESHSYVLDTRESANRGSARLAAGNFDKQLHVSPLMGMDHTYELRVTEPGERISVHISSSRLETGEPHFDATLSLARRELTPGATALMLARYPLLTVRVQARIYAHALRLRLRGARYHPHPHAASRSKALAPSEKTSA